VKVPVWRDVRSRHGAVSFGFQDAHDIAFIGIAQIDRCICAQNGTLSCLRPHTIFRS
jgi:hypothetical protein